MSRRVVISDENLNSYGFWVKTSGIDISQFEKNPICLWMHNRAFRGTKDEVLPIGRLTDLKFENESLTGLPVFDKKDDFAKSVESKWEDGILNMCSPGFQIIEESEAPEYIKPGQRRMTVLKCKLREVSIVDLGSNDNALGLAFYDSEDKLIELKAGGDCPVALLDSSENSNENQTKMKTIALALGLPESASEAEINVQLTAVQAENKQLKDAQVARELADKTAQQEQAVALVDAAVKEGRINASAKESFLKLFANDFDSAKLSLDAIPKRQDVAGAIANNEGGDSSRIAGFQKLSWDDMDKSGKLEEVKLSYPDLFNEKFKEKFGHDYSPKN